MLSYKEDYLVKISPRVSLGKAIADRPATMAEYEIGNDFLFLRCSFIKSLDNSIETAAFDYCVTAVVILQKGD